MLDPSERQRFDGHGVDEHRRQCVVDHSGEARIVTYSAVSDEKKVEGGCWVTGVH